MAEIIPVKAGGLAPVDFFKDFIIVVSDPRIPDNDPAKNSFALTAGKIRPAVFDWNVTTPIIDIVDLKPLDYVVLQGVSASGILVSDYVLKTGDMLLVLSLDPTVSLLPVITGIRKANVVIVTNADSPYTAIMDNDLLIDVTDGPITVILPTEKPLFGRVNIYPYKGRYEINPLILQSTEKMHGVVDSIEIDIDNLSLQALWYAGDDGWLLFGK